MKAEFDNINKMTLYQQLNKLTVTQFKVIYTALVHYFINHKFFITKQNFFNLRCELNTLCHELDESFPNQYDDHIAMRDFWHFHPYYFIDHLPLNLLAKLFAEHVDNHVDILTTFAKTLSQADMHTAYTYMNDALGLAESLDYLVSETETHIKFFR